MCAWRNLGVLLAVCVLAVPVFGDEPGVPRAQFHVYLLMGQSNMAGRGEMEPDAGLPDRVLKLDASNRWVAARDPLHFDKPAIAGVGPGSGFGPAMAAANESAIIGLVPCAVGGTPLERWEKSGDLFAQAVRRAKVAAQRGVLKGVIWHQGEGDAARADRATTYAKRLDAMVADFRAAVGIEELPFVVGELGEFLQPGKSPFRQQVNDALRELPRRVPATACVDSAGLKAKPDQVHFDAASAREFGRRYAAVMLKLVGKDAAKDE